MANYLDKSVIAELNEVRKKIFELREEAYKKHKIDVLDNDTLSSLCIHEVVSQYDVDYNINFSRFGEDAKSNEVIIEQKCSRIEKKKRSGLYPDAVFQFHAMGNLEYPRYILSARNKADLELIRIYDVSQPDNVKIILEHLLNERNKWLAAGRLDEKKMNRDIISIPEDLLKEKLAITKTEVVNGCEVIWA